MFCVVVLGYVSELAEAIYDDKELKNEALCLAQQIDYGINTYGIYNHHKYGKIYAYETDGYGNYVLMDDANVPSLLSMTYLGYKPKDEQLYLNTRKFILSEDNPYYHEGRYAKGVGSPHTSRGSVWHIGMIMQALTSEDNDEKKDILNMLIKTDAGTDYMHESFDPDNPQKYSREWFAWANSLFAELVLSIY